MMTLKFKAWIEEYKEMCAKGYDALEWEECTYEEYRKVI